MVVGVDASPVGESAIEAAFHEACERDAELVAVHAWNDLSEGRFAGGSYLDIPIAELETAEHALVFSWGHSGRHGDHRAATSTQRRPTSTTQEESP
ncbi:universal stress protein [Nocardia abscessus]|uniref:universal stress protein n=1 Tax=Nocardia abscessus TaxID=120957 RepID=UPI00313E0E42